MLLLQLEQQGLQGFLNPLGLTQKIPFFHLAENCDYCCGGHRVSTEGSSEAAGVRRVHDVGTTGDSSDRHTAADALGARDQVWLNTKVLARKISAGPGHATLHLIGDIDNAIGVTPVDERLEVTLGGDNEPALTLDRLDHEAGNLASAHALLQVGNGALSCLGTSKAIVEGRRVWRVVNRTSKGAKARAVGVHVVVHGGRQVRATVVTVVQDGDLGATGVLAGNFHGVFDGFSARVHQHGLLGKLPRGVLGEKLADGDVGLIARHREERVGHF